MLSKSTQINLHGTDCQASFLKVVISEDWERLGNYGTDSADMDRRPSIRTVTQEDS